MDFLVKFEPMLVLNDSLFGSWIQSGISVRGYNFTMVDIYSHSALLLRAL